MKEAWVYTSGRVATLALPQSLGRQVVVMEAIHELDASAVSASIDGSPSSEII